MERHFRRLTGGFRPPLGPLPRSGLRTAPHLAGKTRAGRRTQLGWVPRSPAGSNGGGGGNRTRVRKVIRRESYRRIRPTLQPSRARRSGRRDLGAPALQHLVRGPRAGRWTSLRLYGARSSPHRRGLGRRHSLLGCESHLRVRRCDVPAFLTRRESPACTLCFSPPVETSTPPGSRVRGSPRVRFQMFAPKRRLRTGCRCRRRRRRRTR